MRKPPRKTTIERRRDHYLQKLRAAGPSETARLSAATDYVKALLATADPELRNQVGEQGVALLLSMASALEQPTKKTGGRR